MYGAFHRNSDVDRLYAPRKDGGRGLCSALDTYYSRLITLGHHLTLSSGQNEFIAKVCIHEKVRLLKSSRDLCTALEIPRKLYSQHTPSPQLLRP